MESVSPVSSGERSKKRIRDESKWKKKMQQNERYV